MNEEQRQKEPKIAPFTVAPELKLSVKKRQNALGFKTEADYMRHLIRQDALKVDGLCVSVNSNPDKAA